MSEIPDDVMEAARKQCDLAGVTQYSDARDYCEYVAAFSIMAERERCAQAAISVICNRGGQRDDELIDAIRRGATA